MAGGIDRERAEGEIMKNLNEGECVELLTLAALVYHDAVVMHSCNQARFDRGLAPAYGEDNLLVENAERLQARLNELSK